MSLDWSIGNCRDWEELNSDEEWPITNELIWANLVVHLGEITEKNWEEFYARYTIWCRMGGDSRGTKVTPMDVHRRIGMATNVFPAKTRLQWIREMTNRELDASAHHAEWTLEKSLPKESTDA